MSEKLLLLELKLLAIRHGRRKIIEALAAIGDSTVDELEREIELVSQRRPKGKKDTVSVSERVAQACVNHPELQPVVSTLMIRYESRSFLPQLKDVRRFLDRSGIVDRHPKSRAAASSAVIRALCSLPIDHLIGLSDQPKDPDSGDYALLASEIMGKKPPQGR